jgi:hypothetical protein
LPHGTKQSFKEFSRHLAQTRCSYTNLETSFSITFLGRLLSSTGRCPQRPCGVAGFRAAGPRLLDGGWLCGSTSLSSEASKHLAQFIFLLNSRNMLIKSVPWLLLGYRLARSLGPKGPCEAVSDHSARPLGPKRLCEAADLRAAWPRLLEGMGAETLFQSYRFIWSQHYFLNNQETFS